MGLLPLVENRELVVWARKFQSLYHCELSTLQMNEQNQNRYLPYNSQFLLEDILSSECAHMNE